MGQISFNWYRHAAEIEKEWRECFGHDDILRSYELQKAVEASNLEDVDIHYMVGHDEQGLACVIPCFGFKFVLINLATPWLKKLVGGIRGIFPGFLQARLFVVGSAVTTCGDHLGFKDFSDTQRWNNEKIAEVYEEVMRKAHSLRLGLIVIKELSGEVTGRLSAAIGEKFFFPESLPTTHVSVAPRRQGGYFQSIRSKYRNKLRKRQAVGEAAGLTWEIAPNCKGYEEEVYRLYLQVLDHSDLVFEQVNKAFFSEVDKALPDHVFYHFGFRTSPAAQAPDEEPDLISSSKEGVEAGPRKQLVAVELVIFDKDTMHPFYSGFDYWIKKDSDLYFNAFYSLIDEAEKRGFTKVHTMQTAYEVKAELGAVRTDLFVGVRHRNPLIHRILFMLKDVFFPKTKVPDREVFGTPPPPKKSGQKKKVEESAAG